MSPFFSFSIYVIVSDKFTHLTKRPHIFINCYLNQAGDGKWRTVKVAGDEQDENSKVGKIVISSYQLCSKAGNKKISFLFPFCDRLDKGPVHLAILSQAPRTRQSCRSHPLNGNNNCNVRK